jgi:hypothetical protein
VSPAVTPLRPDPAPTDITATPTPGCTAPDGCPRPVDAQLTITVGATAYGANIGLCVHHLIIFMGRHGAPTWTMIDILEAVGSTHAQRYGITADTHRRLRADADEQGPQ